MITLERLQQFMVMITRLSIIQKYYKLISIDLSEKQTLDVDPKLMQ